MPVASESRGFQQNPLEIRESELTKSFRKWLGFAPKDPLADLMGTVSQLGEPLGYTGDPDVDALIGSTGFAAASNGPNPYLRQFVAAARATGVPEGWASDPALVELIRRESSWNPVIKNKTSSAFGLGQFLRSTWASYLPEVPYGTADPYWQAVGIWRYIRARYGTPQAALNFWKARAAEGNPWY